MSNKYKIVLSIVAVLLVAIVYKCSSNQWLLSLYKNGETTIRLEYKSKDMCLSAGRSYYADKTIDRFDCGYQCSVLDSTNLKDSPICKQVCNDSGCR